MISDKLLLRLGKKPKSKIKFEILALFNIFVSACSFGWSATFLFGGRGLELKY